MTLALELERARNDRDRQDPEALCDIGDDRRSARARPSAHSGGDEQHVGAFDYFSNPIAIFHRGIAADFRTRARAQSARQRSAELQLRACRRAFQRLCIGVRADEVDAGQPPFDHVFQRIAAAPADADNLDDGSIFHCLIDDLEHDCSRLLSNYRK